MVAGYQNRFIKVFLGAVSLFILAIVLLIIATTHNLSADISLSLGQVAILLILIGYVLYFWSHYLLAKAKGYSAWLTLLALINTFGILILLLLPDRKKFK